MITLFKDKKSELEKFLTNPSTEGIKGNFSGVSFKIEEIREINKTLMKRESPLILTKINLKKSSLPYIYFRNANLRDANLEYANLRDAKLRNADLRNAKLWNADLRDAKLRDANLEYANLEYANLEYANLRDADLRDANLEYAKLRDANLRDADLRNAKLRDADLRNAKLWNANLRNANLEYAKLRDADLEYAKLWNANLEYANLEDAKNLSFTGESLKSAKVNFQIEIYGPAGSREDYTLYFPNKDIVFCGRRKLNLEGFEKAVNETYSPESEHGKEYSSIISQMKSNAGRK